MKPKDLKITAKSKNHGYSYVKVPGHPYAYATGYVYEHRFVIECHIGRFLKPSEIVHHRNEKKGPNTLGNLALTTKTGHAKIHHPKVRVHLTCSQCGRKVSRLPSQARRGFKRPFCSRACAGKFRANGKVIVHGSNSTYLNHKCRCPLCREAHRLARR